MSTKSPSAAGLLALQSMTVTLWLATDVSARWRFKTGTDFSALDFNKSYDDVKGLLLEGFTEKYSHALQQTLFDMGTKVLEAHSEIDEIKFSMPNLHHFLVDLSA